MSLPSIINQLNFRAKLFPFFEISEENLINLILESEIKHLLCCLIVDVTFEWLANRNDW